MSKKSQKIDILQAEQFGTDKDTATCVIKMSVQNAMKHMGLRFTRHAGELASGDKARDDIMSDILIGALTVSNVLGIRLSEQAGIMTHIDGNPIFNVAISAGEFANACEKLDHLEDYPFRESMIRETVKHANIAMTNAGSRDLESMIKERREKLRR